MILTDSTPLSQGESAARRKERFAAMMRAIEFVPPYLESVKSRAGAWVYWWFPECPKNRNTWTVKNAANAEPVSEHLRSLGFATEIKYPTPVTETPEYGDFNGDWL